MLASGDRLIADANTGWLRHDAMRVAVAVRDVDVYIEQPCASYEECLSVRRHTDRPFVLDESIDGIDALLRGHADLAMDVVNLKIGKFGGLSRTRQARDLCVSLGIAMTLEDTWGGDIVTAAIAHLAHSTPPELLFTATDFNSYVTVGIADGAPRRCARAHGGADRPRARSGAARRSAGRAGADLFPDSDSMHGSGMATRGRSERARQERARSWTVLDRGRGLHNRSRTRSRGTAPSTSRISLRFAPTGTAGLRPRTAFKELGGSGDGRPRRWPPPTSTCVRC